jgi:hypothetical protein
VIHPVVAFRAADELVEVADLRARGRRKLVCEAGKHTVLVEAPRGAGVSVVEVHENLVLQHQ